MSILLFHNNPLSYKQNLPAYYTVCHPLSQLLIVHISIVFEKLLAESDIEEFNGAQGRILYVLWQNDNLSIMDLSKKTGLAKTTLTSMLDRMEAAGHIVRTPDPKDRRQIRITLTDQAKLLEDRYVEVSNKMNKIFYQGFTDEEILTFEATLTRILHNLT
ncbi:MAG: MarR family transcriptional regulator [Clostridia bacterium]|nr:MarR family transcriptional regulator [Clostridia bacterium]